MPLYPFRCDKCKIQWDIRMTFQEHEERKTVVMCPECKGFANQAVAPLNFRLAGEGWFGKSSDAIANPYAITQTELNKNLEGEKRCEDYVNTMTSKDENIKEL